MRRSWAWSVSFIAPRIERLIGPRLPEVVQRPLRKVTEALADYTPQGRWLALVMGLSLLFQLLWIAIHVVCGWALGINAPMLLYAVMAPITDILGLAPIFVNNLGAREVDLHALPLPDRRHTRDRAGLGVYDLCRPPGHQHYRWAGGAVWWRRPAGSVACRSSDALSTES